MPAPDLLDPKLDLVFKMQFAKNIDLLIDLIKEEAEKRAMERGMKRGITAGETNLLLRLLRSKFGDLPPSIEERLQTAKPAQLEHWADRVLFAQTLEQVFSNH